MKLSYNKLWKLLIDKGYNKTQLCQEAKITTNAMAKLGKNEDVRVEILAKICLTLGMLFAKRGKCIMCIITLFNF